MHLLTSYALPWLTMLVTAVLISAVMTGLMLSSRVAATVPAYAAAGVSELCDAPDNWQLVYARTEGRVPASYCPLGRP